MHKIFISYSHQDEAWKDRLVAHLGVLQEQGLLEIWDDRRIAAGDDWLPQIEQALNSASIGILLITANFLNSKFILGQEVPRLLERRQKDGVRVIPVIIKPCAWQHVTWLKPIQARPKDGRPLSGGTDHQIDADLAALANEIAGLLKRATATAPATSFQPLPPDQIFTAKLPTTHRELFGREKELKWLDEARADPHTNILTLVAWGGVGKTALVNEWLNGMAKDNYRGAERVYGWSFYSQGTREDKQVAADEFLAHALSWFGDQASQAKSPWDKGVRLAELLRQQKTLLILDGVEPLQYPPGGLKDQGLQALLKELAQFNSGLCVVTTRVALTDLSLKEKTSVKRIDLEHLSPETGAQLLKSLKVKGTEAELRAAAAEFNGHALALNLLGSYLAVVHDGEIRKRDLIPQLTEEEEQGGHARRVMESYERWLQQTAQSTSQSGFLKFFNKQDQVSPELSILYLMGLFDRPASEGAINALRAKPPIKGLTSALQNLTLTQWFFALKHLREFCLLAEKSEHWPDSLDCHPLVREHFGEKLCQHNPAAWKEAHSRLYEYYRNLPAQYQPDTLEEMEPLFATVTHGCQAGRHEEATREVYIARIRRGQENYCVAKLGAFGAELAILSNFFESPWSRPVSDFSDEQKAAILNWAGSRLRALGRLREAAENMEISFSAFIRQKNWEYAAVDAGNLSEIHLILGEVKQAIVYGRHCVNFADRSRNWQQQIIQRTALADALHQAGELSTAEGLFREAEVMQKQGQPECPYLYSVRGYQFCDLLLSQVRYQEVQKRASLILEYATQQNWILDIALDKLSLGHAIMLKAQAEESKDFTASKDYLDQAVQVLRKVSMQHHMPRGLLARAALYRLQGEFAKAEADLEEAREIAERGEMNLHLADYHLEACRLCLAQSTEGMAQKAKEHLETASAMIEKMGYGRRKPEVEALRHELEALKI
ncbi:TIR domain-containing protein [candidate division KSB1 bacterium]|nr:TIR domain-containing protein [candidate division KSB1 bacterium]